MAPRRRRRRGEEEAGALPGEKLFKSYMHPADSSDGRSCFYGLVQVGLIRFDGQVACVDHAA